MYIQPSELSHLNPMECPRCGRRAIVQNGASTYVCINCGFRRDVSSDSFDGFPGWLLFLCIVFGLVLLLGGSNDRDPHQKRSQPPLVTDSQESNVLVLKLEK